MNEISIFINKLEIATEFNKYGLLDLEIEEELVQLNKNELLLLRGHIDDMLLEHTGEVVNKQFNLELAKKGEIGSKITNSDVARIISIYKKLNK